MKTRYDKRDANEPQLVETALKFGARWRIGPPLDGWILWRGQWLPVEIKLPEREGTANEYTPLQKRFFAFCREFGGKWLTWRTDDDVIRDLGGRRAA
jgi:hypothetical protein